MEWSFEGFDNNETSKLNQAIVSIVDMTEEVLKEIKEHLELNERHDFKNKINYLQNRIMQLAILADIEDSEELSDEEIEKFISDAYKHSTKVDYRVLLELGDESEIDPEKRGLDILDYIEDEDDSDKDFNF